MCLFYDALTMSDAMRCPMSDEMRCLRCDAMRQIPANPHGQHKRRESKLGCTSPAFYPSQNSTQTLQTLWSLFFPYLNNCSVLILRGPCTRNLGTLLRGLKQPLFNNCSVHILWVPPHILMTVPLYFTADRDRPLDLPRPPWHLVTLSHTYTLESTLPPKTRDSTYHNKMIYDYDVARTAEVGAAVRQTPSTHPLGIL